MITMRIEPGFKGPTLPELGPFLGDKGAAEVRWTNSRADHAALRRCRPHSDLTLVVFDMGTMSRTALALECRCRWAKRFSPVCAGA
jgi:hypothetical protein